MENSMRSALPSGGVRGLPEGLSADQVLRYIERRAPDMVTLREALAAENVQPIREITHKIKGNAALYGLPDFGLAAARVLSDCDGESWTALRESFSKMEAELSSSKTRYLDLRDSALKS